MVLPMSDNNVDPSGNTEAFRAFTQSPAAEEPTTSKTPLIIVGVVVAVVLIGLVVWLAS
jgi:F0F1-type ATP synthase membrane subunit c/vacuolar-type H+-ATPase subunit K